MSRNLRAKLATETVNILNTGKYFLPDGEEINIGSSIQECLIGTQYFEPEELIKIRDEILLEPNTYLETQI
jgi:hypothetical protein